MMILKYHSSYNITNTYKEILVMLIIRRTINLILKIGIKPFHLLFSILKYIRTGNSKSKYILVNVLNINHSF